MLGADPTTAAAYSAEAAYLEIAARYPEMLNQGQGAVSISPVPGMCSDVQKPDIQNLDLSEIRNNVRKYV